MDCSTANLAAAHRATLRTAGGFSIELGNILPASDAPRLITIGASPSCDWQLQVPGVAQRAMLIGVIEGQLYAASAPESCVLVDGCPLTEAWYKITGRRVFALGGAELELSWNDTQNTREGQPGMLDTNASATGAGRAVLPLHGEGAGLPSVLETATNLPGAGNLAHVAGLLLLAAVSYLAWLVVLDHV